MGTACVLSYANLFLGLCGRDIFLIHLVRHIEGVLLWTRFIDDILVIWQGPEEKLKEFCQVLNVNEEHQVNSEI